MENNLLKTLTFNTDFLVNEKEVTFSEKILMAVIDSLSGMNGKCSVSNKYLCELTNVKSQNISKSLINIKNKGMINIAGTGSSRLLQISAQGLSKMNGSEIREVVAPIERKRTTEEPPTFLVDINEWAKKIAEKCLEHWSNPEEKALFNKNNPWADWKLTMMNVSQTIKIDERSMQLALKQWKSSKTGELNWRLRIRKYSTYTGMKVSSQNK